MLKDLTKSIIGKNITFTIQYTITNNDDKLTSTDRQLQEISRKNVRSVPIRPDGTAAQATSIPGTILVLYTNYQ